MNTRMMVALMIMVMITSSTFYRVFNYLLLLIQSQQVLRGTNRYLFTSATITVDHHWEINR